MKFSYNSNGGDYMDSLLDYEDAARILGIEVITAKKWVKDGKIPCVKFSSRCTRFKREDLDKFINESRIEAA